MAREQATLDWLVGHDPIRVTPLADPVIDRLGFDPHSAYVELFWLGILGPSATWAARALTRSLERSPDGVWLPLGPFAAQLGLGSGIGRHSPLIRTLARLVTFGLAAVTGDEYAMRRRFPPLAQRHVRRLPPHLAALHPEAMTGCRIDERVVAANG